MFVNRCQSCLVLSRALNYCSRVPLLTVNSLSQSMSPSCGVHLYCNHFHSQYHLNCNHSPKSDAGRMLRCLHWGGLLYICPIMS